MAEPTTVSYDVAGPVAEITLLRGDAMNGFNKSMRRELADALHRAENDDTVRVVILAATGRCFSAGADLKEGLPQGEWTVQDMLQQEYRPCLDAINRMPKAVIAAVNGSAAGIGMSIALACDLVVMADSSFLLSPFTTISLVGDGGANWLLASQLGYKRAFELSIMSERIGAAQALEYGLINRVVPADTLLEEVRGWARQIAERAPLSVAATKKAMRHAVWSDFDSTYDLEAELQLQLVGCDDNVEGVAAFFEKRSPNFKGR